MLLGGLWHGANWTFVVWGGLHGLYLVVERWLREAFGARPAFNSFAFKLAAGAITFGLVNVAWVFFRSQDFGQAARLLGSMSVGAAGAKPLLYLNDILAVALIVAGMLFAHSRMRATSLEAVVARTPAAVIAGLWTFMAFAVIISQGSENAFIYFQF
jgi:alginate O-acetyltransferase complex protein AlgI